MEDTVGTCAFKIRGGVSKWAARTSPVGKVQRSAHSLKHNARIKKDSPLPSNPHGGTTFNYTPMRKQPGPPNAEIPGGDRFAVLEE